MKKDISLLLLIAGVIVALLAGAGTFVWLQKRAAIQNRAVVTRSVVVAATDIPWGKVLDAAQVKTVSFLKTSLPQGSFSEPSDVIGRTLLYPVKEGEPLFDSQLAPTSVKTGGVSALISPNKRAMAVSVDKVIGVSGFINPGSHVDVLVTISRQSGDEGRQLPVVTKTVLENVRVLAVGTETERIGKPDKPGSVDVITLEVTPGEGEKLALAATEGKVMLALRNPADMDEVTTKGVTVPVLLSSPGTPMESPVVVARPVRAHVAKKRAVVVNETKPTVVVSEKKPVAVIRVIRGATVTPYTFEKEE